MLKKNLYKVVYPEVLPFNDGKCDAYTIKQRTIKEHLGTFDFHEETVGIQAFTELQTLGIQIDKVIAIPYNNLVDKGRVIKIKGESNYYSIVMIQKKDTFPKSLRLTLTKTNIAWNEEENTNA